MKLHKLKFKNNTKFFKTNLKSSKMMFNTSYLPNREIKRAKEQTDDHLNRLEINGYGKTEGGTCKKLTINGSGTIMNDLKTNKLEINGHALLESNVEAVRTEVNGYCTVEKSLASNNLEVNGVLKVKSDIDSEHVNVSGMLECKQLFANKIDMAMYGDYKISHIVSHTANLYAYDSLIGKFVPNLFKDYMPTSLLKKPSLNSILAHSVIIKDANCNYVGGRYVKIKGNSEIQNVEYTHTLIVEEGAKVVNSKKIESDFDFEKFFGMQKSIPANEDTNLQIQGNSIFSYIERSENESRVTLYPKLDSLNLSLLKKICRECSLSDEGSKQELIERLIGNANLNTNPPNNITPF